MSAAAGLSELLGVKPGQNAAQGSCYWLVGSLPDESSSDIDAAAKVLALRAMKMRCGNSTAYQLWLKRLEGGPPLSGDERARVEPFVATVFGLPNKPLTADHVQGYVAELLWHTLAEERGSTCSGDGALIRLEEPSFSVTEPGGDGLAVYELAEGDLVFRLWEVKKHASQSHISVTISTACEQLSANATKYLAKYCALSKEYPSPLKELYGELVDLWVDADSRAGVGVSVATSAASAPQRRSFTQMGRRFPKLDGESQLEGMVVAIGSFPEFADKVKELVWSGL